MLRPEVRSGGTHPIGDADATSFKGFPNLRSFFLSLSYSGTDVERMPGMMIVSIGPTGWVWTLKDETAATQLRVTAPTWDEVQLLSEALLGDKRAAWVPDLYARSRRSGKKK